jgi:DNA modification methylase
MRSITSDTELREKRNKPSNGAANKIQPTDQAVHDWYRFVLSYPPHLVSEYLERFDMGKGKIVLDPFCGTGTTLVEAKLNGVPSVGVEAHPMSHFASTVKTNWNVDPERLRDHSERIAEIALKRLRSEDVPDQPFFSSPGALKNAFRTLNPEQLNILLEHSISSRPLHKCLTLLEVIDAQSNKEFVGFQRLALAEVVVTTASNLRFGPEVGIGEIKLDAPVVSAWQRQIDRMVADLHHVRKQRLTPSEVVLADARGIARLLEDKSIDAVITSPPYPNEKDYTRTTRLETVLLGFLKSKTDLQSLKRTLLRSNTRTVYKGDADDQWVSKLPRIQKLAETIEQRRVELGKTSGFERLYPRVTKLYFGGMARHFSELRNVLKPGAQLAYVVGDQASYLRVLIKTGELLAEIAESLGYKVVGIDLFRTRLATATREQLREEVVVLRWPKR